MNLANYSLQKEITRKPNYFAVEAMIFILRNIVRWMRKWRIALVTLRHFFILLENMMSPKYYLGNHFLYAKMFSELTIKKQFSVSLILLPFCLRRVNSLNLKIFLER